MHKLSDILKLSRADECIILRYSTTVDNIRWANSTTTTNGTSTDDDLVIISIINNAVGTAAASFSQKLDVQDLVNRSEENSPKQ